MLNNNSPRITAKWKNRADKKDYLFAECSNCGYMIEAYTAVESGKNSTDYVGVKYRFCPMCGAEMTV